MVVNGARTFRSDDDAVQLTLVESGNGHKGGDIRERLAALATAMEHTATKADLQKMENSLIKWMMGTIIVSVITLIVAVLRTLISL